MLFLAVVGCVNQSGVIKYNTEPNVTFTGPTNGNLYPSHSPITFTANVSDGQQGSDELDYYWSISPTGTIDATGQIIAGETVTLKIDEGFDAGEWTVNLLVIDADGAEAEDTVTIVTQDYYAPTIFFASPTANARYAEGLPISVAIQVSDQDQSELSRLGLTWGGIASGNTSAPAHPDTDGNASFTLTSVPLGFQTVSLAALDDDGATENAEVVFEVVDGDADDDGHVASDLGGDDCDDGEAAIHPDRDDPCDGIDNDCDGATDEEPLSWYQDADGDGFGDAQTVVVSCEAGPGLVTDGTDCDDGNNQIYPGASEYCDGVDEDCDGQTDEDALDATTFYGDGDGDGFGDAGQPQLSCTQGSLVADASDCDDGDNTIYPGATEICNGIDDNCDGVVDPASSSGAATWYQDLDGDLYGDAGSVMVSCQAPAGYVADNQDCDDGDGAIYPGALEFCNGYDDSCDGVVDDAGSVDASTWYADADYDGYGDASVSQRACSKPFGYVADNQDCDDSNFLISPAEVELCDGVDNDCDGVIDDASALDVTTWYLDRDADLFGDAATSLDSCYAPSGFVEDNQDCDDRDALINPDATELCDGIDNDCDGSIDPSTSADALTWYQDSDGDTYGNAASTVLGCSQPAGYVADSQDCNDAQSGINLGATEVCNSLDDDCDGLTDDADSSVDTSTGQAFYADNDGDGYGDAGSVVWACTGGTGRTTDGTDCEDATALAHPGLTEVCNDGLDNDCDGTENSCAWSSVETLDDYIVHVVGEAASDGLGTTSIAFGEDADQDGIQPIVIGSTGNDAGGTDAGAVYWLTNPGAGIVDASAAEMIFTGEAGESVGSSAEAFDLDQDGVLDLAVGMPLSTRSTSNGGAVQLLFGPTQSAELSTAGGLLITGAMNNLLGQGIATGDMNDDGVRDLAIGAVGASNNFSRVFVFEGPLTTGTLTTASATFTLSSTGFNTNMGTTVAMMDVDGDGFDDLITGAPNDTIRYSAGGQVFLINGPISGSRTVSVADGYYYGSASYYVGKYVRVLEDVDGDGYPELLIGSSQYNVSRGIVWMVHASATMYKGLITSAAYATVSANTTLGLGPVAAGSMDSDGTMDLVVGAPGHDGAAADAGASLIFYDLASMSGSYSYTDADVTFRGIYASDAAGTRVASGDADGDGRSDLLTAAPGEDSGGSNAGSVYLVWAPNL